MIDTHEMLTVQDLLGSGTPKDFFTLIECLDSSIRRRFQTLESVTSDLIDEGFLDEIRNIVSCENVSLYFGKTLRDLRLLIQDDEGIREHEVLMQYIGPKKLAITSVKLPQSSLQNTEYNTIQEAIQVVLKYVNELARYFYELEHLDESCTIMEPLNPSFKDNYRRIFLDDRTWLHVEVTPEGSATNIHLIGQSEYWHDMLQSGLLAWDHDKDIVDNILSVFELVSFPRRTKLSTQSKSEDQTKPVVEVSVCGICLCEETPDIPGVPQPLCQNRMCGVYFHRICLYQWLVACAGSRPPAFGVATGECPTCLHPIVCNEKDN